MRGGAGAMGAPDGVWRGRHWVRYPRRGEDRGVIPIAVALHPGRHELVLVRGASTSFRYLVIRAGETRVVTID